MNIDCDNNQVAHGSPRSGLSVRDLQGRARLDLVGGQGVRLSDHLDRGPETLGNLIEIVARRINDKKLTKPGYTTNSEDASNVAARSILVTI